MNQLDVDFKNSFLFSCDTCERLFDSLMLLEHHKEEYEHWSSDDEEDDFEVEYDESGQPIRVTHLQSDLANRNRNSFRGHFRGQGKKGRLRDFEAETKFGPEAHELKDKSQLLWEVAWAEKKKFRRNRKKEVKLCAKVFDCCQICKVYWNLIWQTFVS